MGNTETEKPTWQVDDDDDALVAQARGRSAAAKEAFGRLTLKYQDRIYNALHRLLGNADDALDLAQETFLRAFEALKKFKGESKFSTWLWAIALNLRTSKWRSSRASRTITALTARADGGDDSPVPAQDPSANEHGPADKAQNAELNGIVAREIRALPIDYRKVIVMRDIEGMEYEEMGRILKIPDGTLKSRIHRARLELRQRLEKYL
jgi:RNA polymerase sigma-70 factor (ECF subfamily)